ncbi:MAG: hypothetical protein A2Z01_03195 [Betaproteobacteria bacterium RBG_16_58_11]|nr:MAG: hypothetical protein A2Z01_03195 [Betaproteobacteria bacterium RBG_16_58_11]OFZ97833.1 MAG: hypothetical protein A2Z44_00575 [Betaproteobacteria bacterium RBG_19FT_COMBO_58_11]
MSPFAAAFNHVLAQNAWAREKLAPFAGKQFQLRLPPAVLNFSLDASGHVQQATGGTPDATLLATPTGFLRYLTVEPRDPTLITIEGDAEFGAALREILSQLTWEAEEDLSRLFGDVLAHRIAGFAKTWFTWREQSIKRFALSASEYFTEEQALLAKPRHLTQFTQEVAAIEAAVNDLDQRIQKLLAAN